MLPKAFFSFSLVLHSHIIMRILQLHHYNLSVLRVRTSNFIFLLTFAEPIIKPVAKKKFFHEEQDLPTTTYDIE